MFEYAYESVQLKTIIHKKTYEKVILFKKKNSKIVWKSLLLITPAILTVILLLVLDFILVYKISSKDVEMISGLEGIFFMQSAIMGIFNCGYEAVSREQDSFKIGKEEDSEFLFDRFKIKNKMLLNLNQNDIQNSLNSFYKLY